MATPVVESTAIFSKDWGSSSYNLTLPSGITSGDGLIAIISTNNNITHTWPAGWTELDDTNAGGATGVSSSVAYRKADGTEGSTVNVSLSSGSNVASRIYRISGTDFATYAPEVQAATGSSTGPDSPSITHSKGSDDYLYISFTAIDTYTATVSSYPSGYSDTGSLQSGPSGSECEIAWSSKGTTSSTTENPGAFTLDLSRNWVATTIAVPSDGAGGGGGSTGYSVINTLYRTLLSGH